MNVLAFDRRLFAILILLSGPLAAAPSKLDPIFGNGGYAQMIIPGADSTIYGISLESDGDAVVAGDTVTSDIARLAVARFKESGLPDLIGFNLQPLLRANGAFHFSPGQRPG